MSVERYVVRCAVCGVQFETDGIGSTFCCGREMELMKDSADSGSGEPGNEEPRTVESDEAFIDDSEPLVQDAVAPYEDSGILTGSFGVDEDWEPCGADPEPKEACCEQ